MMQPYHQGDERHNRRSPGNRHDADEAVRRRNLRAVVEAFAGVSSGDAARQLAQYTDDLVLELPYRDPPKTVRGKQAALDFLGRAFRVYRMQLTIIDVHHCVDPDELIVEFTSEGHMTTTGKPYANTYIAVMRFRDGRICRQREFFNPVISARALTP
jgi:ketosteroid isomerase-like protein